MKSKGFLCVIFLLISSLSFGQNDTIWTLQKCIDYAFQNSISIKQNILNSESSKITLAQTQANRIPTVSANASQGFSSGRSLDPTLNTYVNRNINSNNFNVSGNLVLFNGLQVYNQIKQNRMSYEASKYDIESAKSSLVLNILQTYYQVLLAKEQVENAKVQIQTTQSDVERTQKMVNVGKAPEINLIQLQSQLANDKVTLINAQNSVYLRKVDLMQLMNLPLNEQFEIESPQDSQLVPTSLTGQSAETVYNQSLQVQPSIKSLTLKKEATIIGIRTAKGAYSPRLSMGGQIFTNYSSARNDAFSNQLNNNLAKTLNFNLSIPILTARQTKSGVERSVISMKLSELQEENGRIQLRQSIELAYANMKSSENAYEASKESMNLQEQNYNNSERRFNLGMLSPYDFIIQKNNFFTSKFSFSQAKYQYVLNAKILEFYYTNKLQ